MREIKKVLINSTKFRGKNLCRNHSLKKVTGQNACNFFKRDSSTVAYQQVLRILEEYVLFRTSADGYLGNMPQHTDPPPGVSCFVKTVFVHPEKPISCSFYNCPTPSILT